MIIICGFNIPTHIRTIIRTMSAMSGQGAQKRQKLTNVTGAGIVIRSLVQLDMSSGSRDMPKLWVQDDDRTQWTEELSESYSAEFVNGERPYNVYTVSIDSTGNYEPLYVPGSAMVNGEPCTFSKAQHGRAMVSHCLTKLWVPTCLGSVSQGLYDELHAMTLKDAGKVVLDRRGNPKYDSKKIKKKITEIDITDEQAEAFIDMSVKYTSICTFKTGIVRGAKENDHHSILDTAVSEGFEEARVPKEFLRGHLRPCGNASYSRGAIACYELLIPEETLENYWQVEGERRRSISNYKCPHGFAQYLPGIDIEGFKQIKAERETTNGRWVTDQYTIEKDSSGNVIAKVVENTILEPAAVNILTQVLNYNN